MIPQLQNQTSFHTLLEESSSNSNLLPCTVLKVTFIGAIDTEHQKLSMQRFAARRFLASCILSVIAMPLAQSQNKAANACQRHAGFAASLEQLQHGRTVAFLPSARFQMYPICDPILSKPCSSRS